ncbi:cyanophycin synthetase [Ruminiclostridium sufflavum DSM 19573]|uniref:Cyanophycin synthetase n=1 Tax=Ruminiclostridium sufflavum DSM 19573 TaxID=1121337 RepID=A0A318Y9U9_9FIRM|nr:cyanophycin synthetase [Ruminiclostridium sufflavum]PYG89163.1 cyanophycin synthetase [Ruminiclostridium sufflavum DSM 19573]
MQIQSIYCFQGRNIYSHKPVIRMVVDIGIFEAGPTREIPGFNKKLLKKFPKIAEHTCGLGYAGGFGERLIEGTYIGHVAEHLILEIHNIMGYSVKYGKTRQIGNSSRYYIIFEYINEAFSVECGKKVIEIVKAFAEDKLIDIDKILNDLKKISLETDMGPSTRAIYEAARRRNIPVSRVGTGSLLKLGYGRGSRIIQASLTDSTSCITADIVSDKQLTKKILMDNMLPVPYGVVVQTEEDAIEAIQRVGFPLVVKPADANQGKGVTVNIVSEEQIPAAICEAKKYSGKIIIEKYIHGKDYRVLVVGNRVCAVAERRPPEVTGDGCSTISELVRRENLNPLRGADHEKPLTYIRLDEIAVNYIRSQGYTPDSIPMQGETVRLRKNGNISTGGTARNCTDQIHPRNVSYAVAAARAVGLDIAGIDFAAEDISCPIDLNEGAIIEVNAAPGLRMHLHPSEGEPVEVAEDILKMIYPEEKDYSIPIAAITGTNGKTTTTRLIKHTFSIMGLNVGMTSTSGIYVGNTCVQGGDMTGPASAGIILSDKSVDVAVLETARGGIVRKGLGYDLADVGVLVNISDDHLGIDGINTIEELADIKALVIEAIKPDGYAVLNADDDMTPYMLSKVRSNVIMFSRTKTNALLKKHCKNSGNIAVFVREGYIWVKVNAKSIPLIDLNDIPITFGGLVDCNIENALAAVSALVGMKVPMEIIKKGMETFRPDIELNPGRFNIFDMGEFKVMLDYSHNIAGYTAVIKFVQKLKAKRLVGIVGMPGDRLDSNIKEVGELCAKAFEKLYIKEDIDLRGRKKGEVADILKTSIINSGGKKEDVEIILSETEALEKAMLDARPGDMIALFFEELDKAIQLISKFKQEQESTDFIIRNSINTGKADVTEREKPSFKSSYKN